MNSGHVSDGTSNPEHRNWIDGGSSPPMPAKQIGTFMKNSIQCWSCKTHMSLDTRSAEDGYCPHCHAEIDLEDYLKDAYKQIEEYEFRILQMENELIGPFGYATWKDAAVAERVRRVTAEKVWKEVQKLIEHLSKE